MESGAAANLMILIILLALGEFSRRLSGRQKRFGGRKEHRATFCSLLLLLFLLLSPFAFALGPNWPTMGCTSAGGANE